MPENVENDFERLLRAVSDAITNEVHQNDIYKDVSGDNFWKVFEKDVAKKLDSLKNSIGKPNWKITHQGGHKFPDIIVEIAEGIIWGVEVKTIAKDTNWVAMGGSINESTSDKDITNIYLFCAKRDPFEIKYKRFEKCVKTVAITHSPRYVLDLELADGETIFDKVTPPTTYEAVRNSSNPFSAFRDYLTKENEGKETWWNYTSKIVDEHDKQEAEFVTDVENSRIKFYSDLDSQVREKYNTMMMVLFPQIIGIRCNYDDAVIWLFKKSIVTKSFRDNFSAGPIVTFEGVNISSKIHRIYERRQQIIEFINAFNKGVDNAD